MSYPRLGEVHKSNGHGLCILCNEPKADSVAVIEFDIFRGNDVVLKVHKRCTGQLKRSELFSKLMEYLRKIE